MVIAVHCNAAFGTDDAEPRQKYSRFQPHNGRGYALATYSYKPYSDYRGYKYHYVVCPNDDPTRLYLFNPVSRRYYGRLIIRDGEVREYQSLPVAFQSERLSLVRSAPFERQSSLPVIPESTDNVMMIGPPASIVFAVQPF
ncbi:MAG: hypothetical protein AAF745_07185 [Planctomycetota bacterium]